MRRCKNKHTWCTLQLCDMEVRKQGRAQFKRTKTVCFHSGKLLLLCGILEELVCPEKKKKPVTLVSRKHSMGILKWQKTKTQLSWLVKLHCGVFRKDAAAPGFEEELVGWLWCPTQTSFLCCSLPATGVSWQTLLEHLVALQRSAWAHEGWHWARCLLYCNAA